MVRIRIQLPEEHAAMLKKLAADRHQSMAESIMSIFIDTSGFIAVLDKDDASHTEAAKIWRDILTSEEDLVTANHVLVESCASGGHGNHAGRFEKKAEPRGLRELCHHAAFGDHNGLHPGQAFQRTGIRRSSRLIYPRDTDTGL
jgi:hypothetical protein